MQFSILIPSWNNLPYLQACVQSILVNSQIKHQIIIHVNEGSDGTLQWVKDKGILHTHSLENIGVCNALNSTANLASTNFILYMNDDMYCAPNWDRGLIQEIENIKEDFFMLSATMVEAIDTKNKCVIVNDFGKDIANFQQDNFEKKFSNEQIPDWSGAFWPPNVVPTSLWKKVNGFSPSFSPGMGSDDDFAMKCWQEGCRIYKGIGTSFVYHFACKSTGRIIKNNGALQFLQKWGFTKGDFKKHYLQLGKPYSPGVKGPSSLRKTLLLVKGNCKLFFMKIKK
jgi:glycosyltransferase involved in cell wall biosynthesis